MTMVGILAFGILCAPSPGVHLEPYLPNPVALRASYQAADDLGRRVQGEAKNLALRVVWSDDGGRLIYRRELGDGNAEYVALASETGRGGLAFDHARLAAALAKATGTKVVSERMTFVVDTFAADGKAMTIRMGEVGYRANLTSYEVEKLPPIAPARPSRPNGENPARIRDGRLEIRKSGEADWRVIGTTDGITRISASPDGKAVLAFKLLPGDRRKVYLLKSSVASTSRATLEERLYDQPGDKCDEYEVYHYDLATEKETKVAIDPIFGGGQPWGGPPGVTWSHGEAILRYPIRGYQEYRIVAIDPNSGKARTVHAEKSPTFVDLSKMQLRLLEKTDGMLWQSERSGWNHLYRLDRKTGGLTQVTKGDWVVRSVQHIDEDRRQIWFTASGFGDSSKDDPYHIRYCRIAFDGTGFVTLTPGDGTHSAQFSPNREYLVDTYSRVDLAPVHELRRASDGKLIRVIERADIGRIPERIRLPERFVAKGRDGVTDIWGVVIRPSHFDETKVYPVIENIYAGPHDSFVPKGFRPFHNMHRLAELGFIVVQIDGMGTNNRGKKFHDVAWKNIVDAGFPDRIKWMQALAAKYPQADVSRVGVYGTSAGGQNAAGALLFHGDFYDVAVSSCGCHDNRIDKQWWNEQWMGYPVGPHYDEQSNITHAKKLKGKLLLFVGEQDRNVPPESTVRFADALIKANKDFDFLLIPGADHTDGGPYGERRRRDYFVKWLLGVEPPDWNRSG